MKNKLFESSTFKDFNLQCKTEKINTRITIEKVNIGSLEEEKITGFEQGNYNLFYFDYENLFKDKNGIIKGVKSVLSENCEKVKKVLVIGLGNKDIVCDSLGAKVVEKLLLLPEKNYLGTKKVINAITPGVMGVTGIESYDIIVGVIKETNPDMVICIDTLVASEYKNLFNTIQISNTSIIPGSGVKNSRKKLSKKSLGKPVMIFGVPMIITINSLLGSFNIKEKPRNTDMWLSPKDVDFAVEEFAYIFAKSLNDYFYPELRSRDIEKIVKGIF